MVKLWHCVTRITISFQDCNIISEYAVLDFYGAQTNKIYILFTQLTLSMLIFLNSVNIP